MKKYVLIVLSAILLVGGAYAISLLTKTDGAVGSSYNASAFTLAGSATNAVSLPREFSFNNSTTTDAALVPGGYLDGGATVLQSIPTGGQENVRLNILAKAGTATSTLFILQQTSSDESNWFNVHASSTRNHLGYATTSAIVLSPAGTYFDPGLVTTTISLMFDTYGSKFTRFIFSADDLTADPTDGVQAWIQAISIDPIR